MSAEDSGVPTPQLYLLDIEGTVAPIAFVTEVLFPYARAHFPRFLESNWGNADVRADLALLAEENRNETEPGCPILPGSPATGLRRWGGILGAPLFLRQGWESAKPPSTCHPERSLSAVAEERVEGSAVIGDALQYLLWLMDRDRKSTALKSLQGKIWKTGFESGELKAALFPDVPPALERWAAQARIAIYSSGSVEAQKLLFSHTTVGDLTPLISAYFDTRTGAKTAPASYAAIAAQISVAPGEVLFFSDVVRELDAAREAGCRTLLAVREGNAPVEDAHRHRSIASFDTV
jgi:enolase-phosphatase E1